MLDREFYDPITMWPIVFWPVVFSSLLLAIVRVCQGGRDLALAGTLDRRSLPDAMVLYLFFPAAAMFELAAHSYMIWLIGWTYLPLGLIIYIFGWWVLPALLEALPMVQYTLPMLYLLFALAFVVLLGFANIGLLRALNSEIYGVLTGYPIRL